MVSLGRNYSNAVALEPEVKVRLPKFAGTCLMVSIDPSNTVLSALTSSNFSGSLGLAEALLNSTL